MIIVFERLIGYFAKNHVLTNLVFAAVLIGGIFAWQYADKEELPDITFDAVRISVRYPGAPAEDVEYFVTKPIEDELKGIDGVYRVSSTSSMSQASIHVELERDYPSVDEVITEIRGTVLDVDLPEEIIDDPEVRVFKTSKKAILDVALIHKSQGILDTEGRRELQRYAFALESQLLNLPEVNSVNRRGYLREEIQIKVYPEQLAHFEIPLNTVIKDLKENQVRQPAGNLEAKQEPKVTLVSELNTPEQLGSFIIQGGFEGQVIRLGEVAEIDEAYEKSETVYKVNGHEAVILNVVKNGDYGILDAIDAVKEGIGRFKTNSLQDTNIELVLLDDESIDLRNRLNLIAINGSIGFLLILAALFIFLNRRSGIWVAMGIPFTLCFALIGGLLLGNTINGTTLAAVIIVLGIVVDDAIVVAENVTRLMRQGVEKAKAVVQGTSFVFLPILASIATTCMAFVPLFFFTGRFSKIIEFIPPVIFLMLGASLFESVCILPGHMSLDLSLLRRLKTLFGKESSVPANTEGNGHWFEKVEDRYGQWLGRALKYKTWIIAFFCVLLMSCFWVGSRTMKFVMFPHEETRSISLRGETPPDFTRYETAREVTEIEEAILPYVGKEVVGFRTQIARSRRGGAVEENKFRMIIEIVPKEKRSKSADQLVKEFRQKTDSIDGFKDLMFEKSRWGQESGKPLELRVQQNNDAIRGEIVDLLVQKMRQHPEISDAEVDEGLVVPEYRININREKVKRLSIGPSDIASTFRAALEGSVLYDFSDGDEDIYVRLTTVEAAKDDIEKVLDIPVENRNNYLVPLRDIVHVERVASPNAITRYDRKRTTIIDAGLTKGTSLTPVEAAEHFETEIFPDILSRYPTTTLFFAGEVQDTRESEQDLRNAVILVLILIYVILAVLFNSLLQPFIIMLTIPFGLVGVILAFMLHGKFLFGFYAAIGVLGLAGVVINDSIIMLVKLNKEYDPTRPRSELHTQIASISKTRLRAVLLTTLTTVVGVMPTAYGFAGYDAMLAEMMLALAWGLIFGTLITLLLVPCVYSVGRRMNGLIYKREAMTA